MADPLNNADIQRVTENVNKVNEWAEGDVTTEVVMGGKTVPSPAKVIQDSKMFKPSIDWPALTEVTDGTQSYLFEDVLYIPKLDLLPFTTGANFNPDNWRVLNSVPDNLVGNTEGPLTRFPFKKNLLTEQGENPITFTRATTGRYVDRYGRIQEAAIDTPRFEKQGLLMEGESENLCLHSESFDNAVWTDIGTPAITPDFDVAPDGTSTADALTDNDNAAFEGLRQNITVAANTSTYSLSVFVKEVTGLTGVSFNADFGADVVDGNAQFEWASKTLTISDDFDSGSVIQLADGWFRIQLQIQNNNETDLDFEILAGFLASEQGSFFLWGAQIEELDMTTSYIPTTTIAVTREADHAIMTAAEISPAWNRSILDGLSYVLTFDILRKVFTGLPAEQMTFFDHSPAAAFYSRFLLSTTGVLQYRRASASSDIFSPSINTEYKAAIVVDSDERVSVYIDDALQVQEIKNIFTDDDLPTSMFIGSASAVNDKVLFGHIRDFRIYDRELTSEEIRAL